MKPLNLADMQALTQPRLFSPAAWASLATVVAILALLPLLNLFVSADSALHVPSHTIALLG